MLLVAVGQNPKYYIKGTYTYMLKLSHLCSAEGKITVYNVGTKADGEFEDIKGTAEAPNPAAPAALLVTFPIGEW